jgi:hypothetical protein
MPLLGSFIYRKYNSLFFPSVLQPKQPKRLTPKTAIAKYFIFFPLILYTLLHKNIFVNVFLQ